MKIVAVIPAYNEEKYIGKVIDTTLKYIKDIIVVDNNSKDFTAAVAEQHGATVLKERIVGQGATTRRSFEFIKEHDKTVDIIVTLDGDGQHDPGEIPRVLAPVLAGYADIVIGSRFCNGHPKYINLRAYRKFGIDIINLIYNFGHRHGLTDTQSCFRAYNRRVLDILKIEESGFGFSTELLIKARKSKLIIAEVPVTCIYHKDIKANSTLNPLKQGLIVAWKTFWWRVIV